MPLYIPILDCGGCGYWVDAVGVYDDDFDSKYAMVSDVLYLRFLFIRGSVVVYFSSVGFIR